MEREEFSRKHLQFHLNSKMLWPDVATVPVANWGLSALIVVISYVAGCFTTGYYLVRWRGGSDIRELGSGSTGATNVGRALGSAGFAITFALDLLKGTMVAWLAMHFGLGPWARQLCAVSVVTGHIWPVQLRFRGGKGVATLLGVTLIADYRIVLIMAALCVLPLVFLRRFTPSGLLALAAAPLVTVVVLPPPERAFGLLLLVVPVLWAHRENIREEMGSLQRELASKSSAGLPTRKE